MGTHVLLCAPVIPEFDRESGSKRIFNLLEYLRDAGFTVSFVAENPHGDERYARALRERGIAVYAGFDDRTDALFSSGVVDVAVFAFWYLAAARAPQLRERSPSTRVLVDTIDLHFLRNSRRLLQHDAAGAQPVLDADYGSEIVRELNAYASADGVLTVSQKEADLVDDLLGRRGHAVAVPDAEELPVSPVPLARRQGVLFVGNFRHPPNVQAAEHLCRDLVPLMDPALLRRHPVSIVGNAMPQSVLRLAQASGGRVRAVGWVPSLEPYLDRARVAVLPLLYGAGTKRKLIQALMVGTPTVSTSVGAEGLDVRDGQDLVIADEPAAMAAGVERLLVDDAAWARIAQSGAARVRGIHGHAAAREQLVALVERTLRSRPAPALPVGATAHYRDLVAQVVEQVAAVVPPRATVAVVSRGDDALLDLGDRTAWHYPQTTDGRYAGHHPGTGVEALAELEQLRDRGADYLVVPRTAAWWLEHYRELEAWLTSTGRRLDGGDACQVFALPGGRRTA